MTSIIRLLLCTLFLAAPAWAGPLTLPRDAAGWTIFTPSAESRIMYVSESGTDPGTVYTSANHPDWSNPFNPTGTINAFATYAAAAANMRGAGYPDWILFKRGETFTLSGKYAINDPYGGASATEPKLFGAYGTSGNSPVVKTAGDVEQAIRITKSATNWIAFSGLDFYSSTRDPLSSDYITPPGGAVSAYGFYIIGDGTSSPEYFNGIIIEGCKFRFFSAGGNVQTTAPCSGLVIRRNIFLDSYYKPGDSYSKGLWLFSQSLLLEENIFDHNGWYSQAGSGGIGEATMFEHNMYFNNLYGATIRNNISMRSGSIGLKITGSLGTNSILDLTINNNLFYDNEINIQLEDNYHALSYRVKNCTLTNNVITDMGKSAPTNRTLGWGIQLASWDGGIVKNNLITHQNELTVDNSYGISIYGTSRDVVMSDNVLYGLRNADGLFINSSFDASLSTNMEFSNNKIQIPEDSYYTAKAYYDPSGIWAIRGNKYYSDRADTNRFAIAYVNKTFAEWEAITGDTSAFEQASFPDASRTIASYMGSIGETATDSAFVAKVREQDRYDWDSRFTADAVNDYIRAGFGMSEYTPPGQARRLSLGGRPIKLVEPGP